MLRVAKDNFIQILDNLLPTEIVNTCTSSRSVEKLCFRYDVWEIFLRKHYGITPNTTNKNIIKNIYMIQTQNAANQVSILKAYINKNNANIDYDYIYLFDPKTTRFTVKDFDDGTSYLQGDILCVQYTNHGMKTYVIVGLEGDDLYTAITAGRFTIYTDRQEYLQEIRRCVAAGYIPQSINSFEGKAMAITPTRAMMALIYTPFVHLITGYYIFDDLRKYIK